MRRHHRSQNHARNTTPNIHVHDAIESGRLSEVALLVKENRLLINTANEEGWTRLQKAVFEGQVEIELIHTATSSNHDMTSLLSAVSRDLGDLALRNY